MKLFYGAGHIRKYAPFVFAGGLFNPILCILLIYLLPENASYTGAAIAYTAVYTIIHMIIMPKVTANSVGLELGTILRPSLRPLLIAIVVSPALLAASFTSDTSPINWAGVILGVGCYGVAYGIASWWLMLSRQERGGVKRLARKIIQR